jgi:hypothetical protein
VLALLTLVSNKNGNVIAVREREVCLRSCCFCGEGTISNLAEMDGSGTCFKVEDWRVLMVGRIGSFRRLSVEAIILKICE